MWIVLCLVAVTPVVGAVIVFETRRRPKVPHTSSTPRIAIGGTALFAGILAAMALGARPGAYVAVALVGAASWVLRTRRGQGTPAEPRPEPDGAVP